MQKMQEDSRSIFSRQLEEEAKELQSLLKQIDLDTQKQIIQEEEKSSLFSPIHLKETENICKTTCT